MLGGRRVVRLCKEIGRLMIRGQGDAARRREQWDYSDGRGKSKG